MALSLYQNVKWREQYVSSALNKKFSGVFEPGVYSGFELSPGGGMSLLISPDEDFPNSVAIIERNGYSISVLAPDAGTVTVPAKGTFYVCLEAYYAPNDSGYQQVVFRAAPEDHHVVLGKIIVPLDATEITADMISEDGRMVGSPTYWLLDIITKYTEVQTSLAEHDAQLAELELIVQNYDSSSFMHNQYLSNYPDGMQSAIDAMQAIGKSLLIDIPFNLDDGAVDCKGVGLIWLSEGNLISNGTVNINGCHITAGRFKTFDDDVTLLGTPDLTPVENFEAATKKYVDDKINKISPSNKIIGLAEEQKGNRSGLFAWIDENGNRLFPDPAYFNNHPIYRNIIPVVVDGQSMIRIPKFYYKVNAAPSGSDLAGKVAWWISDIPVEGFELHPAFYDGSTEIDHFYLGAFECVDDPSSPGVKAASLLNKDPFVNIDFSTMKARCSARNTGGVEGFHLWNIYELSAVQMLCLIESGSPDVQAVFGVGNANTSAALKTGQTDAEWRGVYELWGNVWHMVDGLEFNSSNLMQIIDPNTGDLEDTTVTLGEGNGWVDSFNSELYPVFIPENLVSGEFDCTYSDYVYSPQLTEQNICYHGGRWTYGAGAGLFCLYLGNVASDSGAVGGRLAKK